MRSRSTFSASAAVGHFDLGLLDEGERMALEDRVALGDRDLPHDPAGMRADDVFHLHRFHHEELLALANQFALAHVDGDDRSLHRRRDRDRVFRSGDFVMRRGAGRAAPTAAAARRIGRALAVAQHRQRIDRVDFGPGQLPGARRALGSARGDGLSRVGRVGEEEPAMSGIRCGDQLARCAPRRSACRAGSQRNRDAAAGSGEIRCWSRRLRSETRTARDRPASRPRRNPPTASAR